MIIASATGDNPYELFPVLWLGTDKPKDVQNNAGVKDFRPKPVAADRPEPAPRPAVDETPKASSATEVAELSGSASQSSKSDGPETPASVVKDQIPDSGTSSLIGSDPLLVIT